MMLMIAQKHNGFSAAFIAIPRFGSPPSKQWKESESKAAAPHLISSGFSKTLPGPQLTENFNFNSQPIITPVSSCKTQIPDKYHPGRRKCLTNKSPSI